MKKLLLSSFLLVATFGFIQAQSCEPSACCEANGKSTAGISKAALKKIVQQKYQDVKVTNIAYSNGYYKTTLLASNNQKMLAYYNGKGKWQSTKRYMSKATLPAKVRQTLKDQNQWKAVNAAYKMEYPTRKGGYVAKTTQGKRIDFDYKGACLTNFKCTKNSKCDRSKCDVSKCEDKDSCKPGSCNNQ
ncbi:MAG TPA: hypothetical protein DCS93_20205 [Microscillaceae bacterium]|nr:hypothetical protein [Microscillaceae bacterium]